MLSVESLIDHFEVERSLVLLVVSQPLPPEDCVRHLFLLPTMGSGSQGTPSQAFISLELPSSEI